MDDLYQHTRERWNELVRAGVQYSRPWLDLDVARARERVDPLGLIGDVRGKRVLCLAGGGGQQSVAFGLLGAVVTVLDLSDEMLRKDKIAAQHYGLEVETIRGNACDLSCFPNGHFDIVWQGHSLPFIPDLQALFDGVARVLRQRGLYHLSGWNPLAHGCDRLWTGKGYLLKEGYVEGAETVCGDGCWDVIDEGGRSRHMEGPREFRHTLTAIMTGLIDRGWSFR